MSLLDLLSDERVWEDFYEYKRSLAVPKAFTDELREKIDRKEYKPVCERIAAGEPFPLPRKSLISKTGSDRKRTVYTYPEPENTVLKLLTYLLLRKYDGLFAGSLYSFRPGRTAKDAVRYLLRNRELPALYAYKADVHDYFNSASVELLLQDLEAALGDDGRTLSFLSSLLTEPDVLDRERRVTESKGMMAGTPLSSFYANLYLSGLDRRFTEEGILYARYSDDMILFRKTEEEREESAEDLRQYLFSRGLTMNPKKEERFQPGEGFVFLGFSVRGKTVDIAPVTKEKLKKKMRRKRDALARWAKRNSVDGEKAARAFVRVFNRKLLESPRDNDLSWSGWFFPVITTADSLREIDAYAQDCLRYLVSGTHTKARYNVRYADLKELGYRPLVHAYYAGKTSSALSGCGTDTPQDPPAPDAP